MRLGLVDYPDANGAATSSSNSYLGTSSRYWSGTPVGRPVEAISSKVLRIGVEMELPRAHPGDVNRTINNRMKLPRTRREFFNRPLSRHHSFPGVPAQTTAACCGRATTSVAR